MKTAIWIIALCSVVRTVQNSIQLTLLLRDDKSRQNAYAEFVKSLKQSDREFVRRMLDEFEMKEGE